MSLSFAGELPFRYVGGDPAIDLVNTVDWTTRGLVEDRLSDYERLTRWAEGAAVITARRGAQLRAVAQEHPRRAERVHREAIALRWQLRRIFMAVANDERLESIEELDAFNSALREALYALELGARPRGADRRAPLEWSWRDASKRLESLLWPVRRSAADLLTSAEALRIRECAGTDCGWMYVDRSRNGLRRWCEMETCGNREKSRRRAKKA